MYLTSVVESTITFCVELTQQTTFHRIIAIPDTACLQRPRCYWNPPTIPTLVPGFSRTLCQYLATQYVLDDLQQCLPGPLCGNLEVASYSTHGIHNSKPLLGFTHIKDHIASLNAHRPLPSLFLGSHQPMQEMRRSSTHQNPSQESRWRLLVKCLCNPHLRSELPHPTLKVIDLRGH